jgi:hypothetical protein
MRFVESSTWYVVADHPQERCACTQDCCKQCALLQLQGNTMHHKATVLLLMIMMMTVVRVCIHALSPTGHPHPTVVLPPGAAPAGPAHSTTLVTFLRMHFSC